MAIIGEWIRRLGYLLRRRAMEDELRREMESHRALMEDPRAFGNTLRLREEARDAWGWRWLEDLVHDTRFALRTLRRSPGFALTAVLTLALGIGVNAGMFNVINSLLLRPLYERPDEVVGVHSPQGLSYLNYVDLRDGTADLFENLAASATVLVGLDVGQGARRTLASVVTANYFEVFGQPLALGRPFTPEEERLGAGIRVAIVSYPLWERLGADASALGRSVRLNGEPFTVIGVAAEGFTGASIPGADIWMPLGAHNPFNIAAAASARLPDEGHELSVVGRLRARTSRETVAPALVTVARRLAQAFPALGADYELEMVAPLRLMFLPGPGAGAMTAFVASLAMVMPAIVLLVACLNLANLLVARGHMRRQELAIRSSLGGGRWRITRQLLSEGLLLALAGGAIGLLLSTWATKALMASLGPVVPVAVSLPAFDLDWRVLVGTVGFSLVASVVFSAVPAWRLTGRAVVTDLKRHGGEDGRQPGAVGTSNRMMIEQVALSLLLLASGGLFLMSAISAAKADAGFRLDGALLVEIDPSLAGYDESRGRAAQLAIVDRLRTVPGVEAATIGSRIAFSSMGDSRNVAPAGAASTRSVDSAFSVVGRDSMRVLGLPMLGGRDFTEAELAPGSEPVAIVDDALADELWVGENALDRLIRFLDAEGPDVGKSFRVVGIVPAVKHSLGNARPFPHVYVPLGQRYESASTLQLRIADANAEQAMLGTIAGVIRSVDERVPVLSLATWRDHLNSGADVWLYRAGAIVFGTFGAIALLLTIIGVYGVKSYVVSRRTHEFGIRLAVGAHPGALLWQVLREGSRITVIGIGIGLLLAVGAGQVLQGILYGVNGFEPVVLVTAPSILLASSLLASYLPARRATKVDPTVALRAE